jgi:hypothetical protein
MKCTSRESRSSLATAIGHAFPLRRAPARAAVERVGALARLDPSELGGDLEALGLGEAGDGGASYLRKREFEDRSSSSQGHTAPGVEPEPRAALASMQPTSFHGFR